MPTEPSWPIYSLKLKSRKDLFTFPGLCTNSARPALLDQRGFRENGHRCVNRRHHLLHHRVGLPLLWPESDARASHELCLVSLIEALKKMSQENVTRLLVMRGDQMMGMITQTGLLRVLEIKRALAKLNTSQKRWVMARKPHRVNAEETYLLGHSMELSFFRMQRPLLQPMAAT